ncbi:hypothetical protein Bhyg_16279 [Pseudolycoriella hygida]|uniref:Uncharacterized protein n=1 Tax=Pseudolycoriella hygida TaxID=35572 RepID=A0A9Q0MHD1_9DIPT|nr:hypothetical protein Bhyg_16288 [Pseudolycoriella hygida]KAJ6632678.1 hypothetical protein Bhyg_16279 [Pseudolycoriella hygida]
MFRDICSIFFLKSLIPQRPKKNWIGYVEYYLQIFAMSNYCCGVNQDLLHIIMATSYRAGDFNIYLFCHSVIGRETNRRKFGKK